jgi:hypothetical protein
MGAVGGIRNIKAAAQAAALVKDRTKHSFLVGEQAGMFAAEMGLPWATLTTQVTTASRVVTFQIWLVIWCTTLLHLFMRAAYSTCGCANVLEQVPVSTVSVIKSCG